jgi:DNA-binding transcriptional ArsR family regulator
VRASESSSCRADVMFRLHFGAGDLERVRLVASYGPYAEALFSLGPLADGRRDGAVFGGWRQRVRSAPNGWAAPLYRLIGGEPMLDLFTLMGRVSSVEEGTHALLGVGRRQLRAEVEAAATFAEAPGKLSTLPDWAFRLHDDAETRYAFSASLRACIAAAIEPHWAHIKAHLDLEVAMGARVLAQDGLAKFLDSLHPNLRWRDGTLMVSKRRHGSDGVFSELFRPGQTDVSVGVSDIHLNGGGLTLVPTVFCRRIKLYIGVAGVDGPAVLFYPALREITDAHRLWTRCHPGSTQDALGALLGTTRAAALETLSNTCTTTELAGRLRTSLATASHHATVLRQAGLITNRRNGNAVLHLITPLGRALLNGGASP